VSYGYDDANRLTSITQGTAVVAFTYDDANRRSTLTYPSGITATYGYDSANQLTSLTYTSGSTTLGTLSYVYDATGRRASVGGSWARTGIPAAVTSAAYDAANRVTAWGATTFSYDLNGNLAGDGTNTYTWNPRDQLTSMSGGVAASIWYDGVGRRSKKTISGTTTRFLYDRLNFVQELSSGGAPTANLMTGLRIDEAFTRTAGSGAQSLLADSLGSILGLADGSGTVQTQYTYEPFGTSVVSGASSTSAMQFTGRESDGTGSDYYRARFYRPDLGRFVSEDRIGFLGGYNLYRYVEDNPVNFVDPLGLDTCVWFGLSASGGLGVGASYFVEIGICKDDCGKSTRKKRSCLCFGLGAGATIGPVLEGGSSSPDTRGWSFSTPWGGMSGSPWPEGLNWGPGAGAFYFKCICDVRDF
jgi:RHS repeat-associated protein